MAELKAADCSASRGPNSSTSVSPRRRPGTSSPIQKATSSACSSAASTRSDACRPNNRCSRHPTAAGKTWGPPPIAGGRTWITRPGRCRSGPAHGQGNDRLLRPPPGPGQLSAARLPPPLPARPGQPRPGKSRLARGPRRQGPCRHRAGAYQPALHLKWPGRRRSQRSTMPAMYVGIRYRARSLCVWKQRPRPRAERTPTAG